VGASQQRDPTEYARQAAQGCLLGLAIPNINKSDNTEKGSKKSWKGTVFFQRSGSSLTVGPLQLAGEDGCSKDKKKQTLET
jgi:hypothetical protein